jgi:hypothetical protein
LAQTFQKLHDLTESAEIQERQLRARFLEGSRIAVIRPTQSQAGMGAVREAEDHVRISASAEADDFTPLPTQGVMRVSNRDESQGWLGYRGSVL